MLVEDGGERGERERRRQQLRPREPHLADDVRRHRDEHDACNRDAPIQKSTEHSVGREEHHRVEEHHDDPVCREALRVERLPDLVRNCAWGSRATTEYDGRGREPGDGAACVEVVRRVVGRSLRPVGAVAVGDEHHHVVRDARVGSDLGLQRARDRAAVELAIRALRPHGAPDPDGEHQDDEDEHEPLVGAYQSIHRHSEGGPQEGEGHRHEQRGDHDLRAHCELEHPRERAHDDEVQEAGHPQERGAGEERVRTGPLTEHEPGTEHEAERSAGRQAQPHAPAERRDGGERITVEVMGTGRGQSHRAIRCASASTATTTTAALPACCFTRSMGAMAQGVSSRRGPNRVVA